MKMNDYSSVEHYKGSPKWAKDNNTASRAFFTRNISVRNKSIPFTPWGIYFQEENYQKLGLKEVKEKNPHSLIKRGLVVTVPVSIFIAILQQENLTDPLLFVLSSILVLATMVLLVYAGITANLHYPIYDKNLETDEIDKNTLGYAYVKPSVGVRHRYQRSITGAVLAGKVPEDILNKYNFSWMLSEEGKSSGKTAKRSYPDVDKLDYLSTMKTTFVDREEAEKYTSLMRKAFNNALDDPITGFETKELAYALMEYNERISWSEDDEFLKGILHSLFAVVDDAWNRKEKEEEDKRLTEQEQRELEEKQSQDTEDFQRDHVREDILQRRLTVVEAFKELTHHNDSYKVIEKNP